MYWSYLLTAFGVTGLWFVTKKHRVGFLIGMGVQALWIAYALVTLQYGFIVSALVYGGVNYLGWRRFGRPTPGPDLEVLKREAYIRGLSDAAETINVWDLDEGLRRVISAVQEEKKKLPNALVEEE